MKGIRTTLHTAACLVGLALIFTASPAAADQVILDDLIVDGSLCVGFDCVNGESFGFDTIRLKENNLRIHFLDTSTAASFPPNDWRIRINDSSNGGASYFAVEDATAARTPFRVDAGARTNALYVDSQGDIGIGTATPAVDIHVKTGDTPTLRLEQDGTSGFAPQTWDVAGNETNFFIRDVTNGSKLPIRSRPGAPTSSLDIAGTGRVGLGTSSPDASLEVKATDSTVAAGNAALKLVKTDGTGDVAFQLDAGDNGSFWNFSHLDSNDNLVVSKSATGASEFVLTPAGALTITGAITTGGLTCGGGCDRVFDPDYELESIEEHATLMWQNRHLPAVGPTVENAPINLSDKTGRMLNELEKAHIYIERMNDRIKTLEAALAEVTGEK